MIRIHSLNHTIQINRTIKMFRRIIPIVVITVFLSPFLVAQTSISHASSLDDLNKEIDAKRKEVRDQEDQIKAYEEEIESRRKQALSLENELAIISSNIEKTKAEIISNEKQIELTKSEIQRTETEIDIKSESVHKQKTLLKAFIAELNERDQKSPLEIWFKNNAFSEFLDQTKYIETLQEQGQRTLNVIQQLKAELEWKRELLQAEENKLVKLQSNLEKKNKDLEYQQVNKEELLVETQNDEEKFNDLIERTKIERERAQSEISAIEQKIRDTIRDNGGDENLRRLNPNKNAIFMWPVSPSRGISAFFRDPTYPFPWAHNAIDIRAHQGTPVLAADEGYVAKVRSTGTTGFNYLLLYHNQGYTTMYGHLSAFYVVEGNYVQRGDTIGLSGGAPGSIGAGTSTGPHLHFEVRKDGSHIDPLTVLP